MRGTGGAEEDIKLMHDMLDKAAIIDITKEQLANEIGLLSGTSVSVILGASDVRNKIIDTLVVFLFEALFGPSYSALEICIDSLDAFGFGGDLRFLIQDVFEILPAYDVPTITMRQPFSRCCSVVQSGGYVLMSRILAEEEIINTNSTPFIMVPGRLAKDGIPINKFAYQEQHSRDQILDIRPDAPVPSNVGESNIIDYVYEAADFGYSFHTIEAGHRLNLDWLIGGIMSMHKVDDSYSVRTALTRDWQRAAPHHDLALEHDTTRIKTVYLTYGNVAGRRLALSQSGHVETIAVVHTGKDYGRALACADQYGCKVVIL